MLDGLITEIILPNLGRFAVNWAVLVLYAVTIYLSIPFVTGIEVYDTLLSDPNKPPNILQYIGLKVCDKFRRLGYQVSVFVSSVFQAPKNIALVYDNSTTYNVMVAIENIALLMLCGFVHFCISKIEGMFGSILGIDKLSKVCLISAIFRVLKGDIKALLLIPVSIIVNITFYQFVFGLLENRMYDLYKNGDTQTEADIMEFVEGCEPDTIIDALFGIRSAIKSIAKNEKAGFVNVSQWALSTLCNQIHKLVWYPKSWRDRIPACTIFYTLAMLLCIPHACYYTKNDLTYYSVLKLIFGELSASCLNGIFTLCICFLCSVLFRGKVSIAAVDVYIDELKSEAKRFIENDLCVRGYVLNEYSKFNSIVEKLIRDNPPTDKTPSHKESTQSDSDLQQLNFGDCGFTETALRMACGVRGLDYDAVVREHGDKRAALDWLHNEYDAQSDSNIEEIPIDPSTDYKDLLEFYCAVNDLDYDALIQEHGSVESALDWCRVKSQYGV